MKTLNAEFSKYGCHEHAHANVVDAWACTKALHDAGVPILVGSDSSANAVAGVSHGVTVHNEMRMYVDKCSFTPIDALRSATSVATKAFRHHDRGTIEVGKQADLLLVNGDVTKDIYKSLDIVDVWRKGQKLERERTRERVHRGLR